MAASRLAGATRVTSPDTHLQVRPNVPVLLYALAVAWFAAPRLPEAERSGALGSCVPDGSPGLVVHGHRMEMTNDANDIC
jgi:hypothetical protein